MKTVVLCASAAFYEHVNELAEELKKLGFAVLIPQSALEMKKAGNYDVGAVKTWYKNPKDFSKKSDYVRGHLDKVAAGDIILVVNDEKRGVPGYIGSNVLIEMGLAFHLRKLIYVLNAVSKDLPCYEEVVGMGSIFINGDLSKIGVN